MAEEIQLKDSLQTYDFEIIRVLSETYSQGRGLQLKSDIIFGPGSRDQNQSSISDTRVRTTLEVQSLDAAVPINELIFEGFSIAESGLYVRAVVPLFTGETISVPKQNVYDDGIRTVHASREPDKSESAIELMFFREAPEEQVPFRTERSADYSRFVQD